VGVPYDGVVLAQCDDDGAARSRLLVVGELPTIPDETWDWLSGWR